MKILYLDWLDSPQAHGHLVIKWLQLMGHEVFNNQGIKNPDLVLVIKGEHQDVFKIKKQNKCPVVMWSWESEGMPYMTKDKLDAYDYIFNSSKAADAWVSNRTNTPTYWLTQPVDHTIFRPLLNVEKIYDVLYFGTASSMRRNWIIHIGNNMPNLKLAVFGNAWIQGVQGRYLKELNHIMNQSKLIITFPFYCSPNFTGLDINTNHYSLKQLMCLASGSLCIFPENPDFEKLFHKGPDFQMYTGVDDLIHRIKESLDLVDNGYEQEAMIEVHDIYNYENILKILLEVSMNVKN